MASSTARPVVPVDSALVAKLHDISAVNSKLIKSSVYAAPADADIKVRSWKMDEFKYYDIPSPFPTLARGIFTVELPKDDENREQEYRIVARGYDKFFNIGEVPWTTWPALEEHTAPPYTLSLKSNGCIIFIAALTPTQLLVTSKHSVGSTPGQSISHAQAGEGWLRKYFEQKSKTEADLAGVLWANNWTAVAELCDDSFEEHVLPYPPHLTGLHLHGLNTSTSTFHTLPQPDVDAFAAEWGFIRTASITLPTIAAVKEFTAKCGETGSWEGEAVEGFVVRTHVAKEPGKAPYKAGDTFFFKVKFDEPYMMYRDWREVTKTLLRLYEQEKAAAVKGVPLEASTKGKKGKKPKPAGMSYAAVSPHKLRRLETRAYVRWVIPTIRAQPELFAEFNNNKGIIAARERFLEYLKTPEGVKLMEEAKDTRGPSNQGGSGSGESAGSGEAGTGEQKEGETGAWGKTIIVPVGVPGCGKTALAVALLHIFGPTWGHTQSDDVRAKKPAPIFLKNVTTVLGKKEVVIADKNNHLRIHRAGLRAATAGRTPRVRLVALNWAFSDAKSSSNKGKEKSDAATDTDDLLTLGEVHRICAARVTQRGANHQTLRASSPPADATEQDSNDHHERVIWRFLHGAEALAPDEVDDVIEMHVDEELEGAVRRAVEGIVRVLGVPAPTEGRVKEGVEKGEQYAAVAAGAAPGKANANANGKGKGREVKPPQQKKAKPPRYYGFLATLDVAAVLTERFKADAGAAAFLAQLISDKRVAERPHVTIVHSKALEGPNKEAGSGELWEKCRALDAFGKDAAAGAGVKEEFRLTLGSVLWDERVMAITVEDVQPASEVSAEGQAFLTALPEPVRARLHITVGTRDTGVKPVEAKGLVEAWRMGDGTGVKQLKLESVSVQARVRGMFS
ncbi:RNA ligase [Mycena alexandri]|uniref:RNA ligase n=1 Tax=Mycena alexandri TaxID=1745969 RepID=A0AAD6SQJ2_9AGAR|nr:RNA ligase [Mycena alexandri]